MDRSEHAKLPSRDKTAPDLVGLTGDLTGGINKPKAKTYSLAAEESGERGCHRGKPWWGPWSTAKEMMSCQVGPSVGSTWQAFLCW